MEVTTSNEVDILIIGAGVAGCIAAISLAPLHSVLLIDKLSEPVDRIGECLPPASKRILKKLNLLEGLEMEIPSSLGQTAHLKNMGTQSYWGSEQMQVVDPLRNPDGFGWHLNRKAFETYLREIALLRGVSGCWPAKLQTAHFESSRWHIGVTTSNTLAFEYVAKFVIDASGRQSHFAKKLNIQRKQFDKLIACWAILPNEQQNKLSTISASEFGWWYTAALPNNQRVLAFQTDADLVDRIAIKNVNEFVKLAKSNPQMAVMLEKNKGTIDYRGTVAANSSSLQQVVGQQWAALGDAAMSFDPLSSQGMFNAMASAMQLTELMEASSIFQSPNVKKIEAFQTSYSNQMAQIWEQYLLHRNIFYCAERRWEEAPFWKRRHKVE